jgi:hypothetical protein
MTVCGKIKETVRLIEIFNEISPKRVLLLFGVLFIASSFIQYNKEWSFSNDFSCVRLFIGLVFVLLFIVLQICSEFEQVKGQRITTKGKIYKYNDTNIVLQIGNIEDRNLYSDKSIVVLPANTEFDDDCITDKKSALGSFFINHYPDRLECAKRMFISIASQECKHSDENGYELGSTILLPEPFNSLTSVAISAVTTRRPHVGISANLCAVSFTMKNVFEITADKKIDTIIMPAIGSGHGGLSLVFSINMILLNIKYNIQHYHHIKNIKIIIYNDKQESIKLKLVNWRFL